MTEETKEEIPAHLVEHVKAFNEMMQFLSEQDKKKKDIDYRKWDHIVEKEEEESIDNVWRIIHKPGVVVRAEPSVTSKSIGFKKFNELIQVAHTTASLWLKLKHEPGYMLVYGEHLNLGHLIIPHEPSLST